jgi:beta-N-acetylhexosaminidase
VILFARNVTTPAALAALVSALREVLPREAVLMVDQEGGRVARLRPPHWRAHPPALRLGQAGEAACRASAALLGLECRAAGFDVVAAPVLDVPVAGADPVIGDRAFGADPARVAACGRAFAQGLMAAGVQPVGKHAPGHGRAMADSHRTLPRVRGIEDADLVPFADNADLPWMMTAHVLFEAEDPRRPATLSPGIVANTIRGRIGFAGVLVSDDLAMGALAGSPAERTEAALAAGCDLALHCSGTLTDSAAVLEAAPPVTDAAAARMQRARAAAAGAARPLDAAALETEIAGWLA